MEEWFWSLCFIAASTLLALWFIRLACGKSKPEAKKQLPPGPWVLPVIGSLHHVASVLPHRRMLQMSRRYGPLMHLMLGEVPTVIVSSAEAAALVMKANDLSFASRPRSATMDIFGCGGKGIFFAPYGDHCRQMRKLCNVELLSSKQVKRTEGIRTEEVGNLLRSIIASNGAIVNVSEKVAALSNGVVTRAVFGGKFLQQDEYLRELDEALVLVGVFCLVDLFPSYLLARWLSNSERRLRKCQGRIQRIIGSVIDERKAARAAGNGTCSTDDENLLDVLLRMQQEETLELPLTTETIGAVLSTTDRPLVPPDQNHRQRSPLSDQGRLYVSESLRVNSNLTAPRRHQKSTRSSVDYVQTDEFDKDQSLKDKLKEETPPQPEHCPCNDKKP